MSTTDAGVPVSNMVTFYHDIEQNLDSKADPRLCRQMVKEFLAIEKQFGVSATYNVVGRLSQDQPDIIEWILEAGQEVAFHSYNHQSDWKPEYYASEVKLCRDSSALFRGYRSPRSRWDHSTLQSLWTHGFLWNAEDDQRDEPYFVYKGLVRLPIAADDWPLRQGRLSVEQWIMHFTQLLRKRSYFAFGSHDSVTSFKPAERLKAWERLVRVATENHVLSVTFSEAADLFRRAALARHYCLTAADGNKANPDLYRTKRFRELIRIEAKWLNQPVVADLGSGRGVLSAQLADVAKTIYCVDNARGAVTSVQSDGCIQPQQGEVTESNLPNQSIDLVICDRIIDYLFWPDRLADEMCRIARPGATYFVTFIGRNDYDPPHTHEGSTPDRIRHYFTPEEIQAWARRVGPGRLVGIQHDVREPERLGAEEDYQKIERNPPDGDVATDWVFIGTVTQEPAMDRTHRTIPLAAFRFPFRDDRYQRLAGRQERQTKDKTSLSESEEPSDGGGVPYFRVSGIRGKRAGRRTRRVTAVIVTYESRDTVGEALSALRAAYEEGTLDCVVVDNASRDGTVAFLESEHTWAKIIWSSTNLGYGRGCNLGLKEAESEFVLFMNPDVVLTNENLNILIRHMDTHPNAGIVAPASVAADGRLQTARRLPTPWRIIGAVTMPRRAEAWSRPIEPGERAFQTDWLCGSVILVRTHLVRALGGFDPRFFLYFEETDLCRRVKLHGVEQWAVGEAVARHDGGASAEQTGAPMIRGCIARHFFQSRFYYLVKHHGWVAASCTEIIELVLLSLRELLRTLRGRGSGELLTRWRAPILRLPAQPDLAVTATSDGKVDGTQTQSASSRTEATIGPP